MAVITFPVAGSIVRVEIPTNIPLDVAVDAARTAVSAGAAGRVKGTLRSALALGPSIVKRRFAAYQAGGPAYAVLVANDAAVLAAAARVLRRSDEPDAGTVLDVMVRRATFQPDGSVEHDLADWIRPEVPQWARTILGHRFGGAGHPADCRPCRLATDRQWPALLVELGISERLVLDLYHAAEETGYLPTLSRPVGGRSVLPGDFLSATRLEF